MATHTAGKGSCKSYAGVCLTACNSRGYGATPARRIGGMMDKLDDIAARTLRLRQGHEHLLCSQPDTVLDLEYLLNRCWESEAYVHALRCANVDREHTAAEANARDAWEASR